MKKSWDVIFRDYTGFWVHYVLVPFLVLIGVLGNSVTIYILTRKRMRLLSNNIYLTAITISDLIFLIFLFTMSWRHYDCVKSIHLYWIYVPFGLWITQASRSTSVWLTVSFTMERYVAVRFPMLTKYPYTDDRATTISTVVCPTCVLLTAATTFEWKSAAAISSSGDGQGANVTTFMLENTDFAKNLWYRPIYHLLSAIIFAFIPFLLLAVGNIFLVNAVRASQKIRQGLISSHVQRHQVQIMRQENRITVILTVIIVIFFICQLPAASLSIFSSMRVIPEKESKEENIIAGLGNVFSVLAAANAVSNFILYVAISDKYRQTFLQIFRLKKLVQKWYRNKCPHAIIVEPGILPVVDLFICSENAVGIEVQEVIRCESCCCDDFLNLDNTFSPNLTKSDSLDANSTNVAVFNREMTFKNVSTM